MAKSRGLGSAGRDRVKHNLAGGGVGGELTTQTQADRDAGNAPPGDGGRGSAFDAFDAWHAKSPQSARDIQGVRDKNPAHLGENTAGTDSTRVTTAQYFFDAGSGMGKMYVTFRRASHQYVYHSVPVYAAVHFYDALSKGKTIGPRNGLEKYGYYRASGNEGGVYFAGGEGTELGKRLQGGTVLNQAPQPFGPSGVDDMTDKNMPSTGRKKSNLDPYTGGAIPPRSRPGLGRKPTFE